MLSSFFQSIAFFHYSRNFMTSWILPAKEKPPSVGSDFSYLVLTVYKLTGNDFHISTTDVVHSLYPHHLIFHFEGFRYALFFGKLFYQPWKQCFRLLMGFRAIGVAKSLPCAVRIKLLTTLFADTLRVLMTVIRRPAFHLGFSSMRSIALTLPVFLALGFFHRFLLGFPYF